MQHFFSDMFLFVIYVKKENKNISGLMVRNEYIRSGVRDWSIEEPIQIPDIFRLVCSEKRHPIVMINKLCLYSMH